MATRMRLRLPRAAANVKVLVSATGVFASPGAGEGARIDRSPAHRLRKEDTHTHTLVSNSLHSASFFAVCEPSCREIRSAGYQSRYM